MKGEGRFVKGTAGRDRKDPGEGQDPEGKGNTPRHNPHTGPDPSGPNYKISEHQVQKTKMSLK